MDQFERFDLKQSGRASVYIAMSLTCWNIECMYFELSMLKLILRSEELGFNLGVLAGLS